MLCHTSLEKRTKRTALDRFCLRVVAVTWGVEKAVQAVQLFVWAPEGFPPNELFVPDFLRSQVLQWVHDSLSACHPAVHCTQAFLGQHVWWPNMLQDFWGYVTACPICA